MRSVIAPISALLLSNAFLLMGNGLQGVLLPVRGGLEAFSPFALGVLGGVYFLGFAVGCLHGPRLIRNVGHIRVFAAMVSIVSANALIHPLIVWPIVWWLLRGLTGYCFATLFMVIESWLNERSTSETRGVIFSIYTIVNLTVITAGQILLPLGDPKGLPLFSVVSILMSLAVVPVALSRAAAPAPVHTVKLHFLRIFRASPVGFVGCLTVGLVNGSFWSLAPIVAQRGGGNTTDVAVFMSSTVIAGALGQWPLGRLSDRIDRRKVIVLACAMGGTAALGLALSGMFGGLPTYPFSLAYGFFALPLYAVAVAHTNDLVAPEEYVQTSSGLLLVYALGAMAGPMAASAAMGLIGPNGLFAFTAVCLFLLAVFAASRMMFRPRAVEAERVDFIESMRMAATVGPMDTEPGETFATPDDIIVADDDAPVPPTNR